MSLHELPLCVRCGDPMVVESFVCETCVEEFAVKFELRFAGTPQYPGRRTEPVPTGDYL